MFYLKDLERNLELSGSSFQRELHSKKKKLYEAQEENRALQEELNQLNQKLKVICERNRSCQPCSGILSMEVSVIRFE